MIGLIKFLTLAVGAYRQAIKHDGVIHAARAYRGVTYMTIYVALDRHAWALDSKMDEVLQDEEKVEVASEAT